MNPTTSPSAREGRARDAAASKDALLQAAKDKFGQQGFERTTIREIGDTAGVDAALIARYFGSKADLYIAAVASEDADGEGQHDYTGLADMTDVLLGRADRRGPGPILQAVVRSDTAPEIRAAAQERIARRLVAPLATSLGDAGIDRPQLRAELAVAALLGITLGRSLGWFDELPHVDRAELVSLVAESLDT